jgi:F0F1-type ATP synthase delta subunit
MIRSQELAEAFFTLLKQTESKKIDSVFEAFVSYLEENNLLATLPNVVRYLESYIQKENDFNTLFIDTAFPLEDETINAIKKFINISSKVSVQTKIDSKLIGGFKTNYQGVVTDTSIAYNLQVLKSRLTK